MRIIKPSAELIWQQPGVEGIYRQIELAGRTCYQSQDRITPDSAEKFTDRLIKSGHLSVLEHGSVYLRFPLGDPLGLSLYNMAASASCPDGVAVNPWIRAACKGSCVYISTNYRFLYERGLLKCLKHACEPTEHHEKRYTVRLICDRGILAEFTRHRVFSFAAESTRYCAYSKAKFNHEVTFIKPLWVNADHDSASFADLIFLKRLEDSEKAYFALLDEGWKPEQARDVLPLSTKTELIMTGFISDWRHFLKLRCANSAHPQARELAVPLRDEFIRRGCMAE